MFPDHLFDLPLDGAPWEIAHLRSRQEKVVARLLRAAEMPFYLPQLEQTTKSSGRTFVSHMPMFPGYIFVRRVSGLQQTLWATRAVAAMISVPDQAQLNTELSQIRDLQAAGAVLTPRVEFCVGDSVRITEGAFSGYLGLVTEERGAQRLVVSISMLRKSIAVEFPRGFLMPLERSAAGA